MNPENAKPSQPTAYTIASLYPSGSAVPHCPLRRGTTRPERHSNMLFRLACVRCGFRGSTCRPARATQATAPAYTIASIQQLTQLCAVIECFALCVPLCSPSFAPEKNSSRLLRARKLRPRSLSSAFPIRTLGKMGISDDLCAVLLRLYRSGWSSAGAQCALGRAYPF